MRPEGRTDPTRAAEAGGGAAGAKALRGEHVRTTETGRQARRVGCRSLLPARDRRELLFPSSPSLQGVKHEGRLHLKGESTESRKG